MPLSRSQISLSLTDKEFLLVKLNPSKRLSDVLMDTDTIGLPINVPANPINSVIIKGGTKIRKADFPEAFNIIQPKPAPDLSITPAPKITDKHKIKLTEKELFNQWDIK